MVSNDNDVINGVIKDVIMLKTNYKEMEIQKGTHLLQQKGCRRCNGDKYGFYVDPETYPPCKYCPFKKKETFFLNCCKRIRLTYKIDDIIRYKWKGKYIHIRWWYMCGCHNHGCYECGKYGEYYTK